MIANFDAGGLVRAHTIDVRQWAVTGVRYAPRAIRGAHARRRHRQTEEYHVYVIKRENEKNEKEPSGWLPLFSLAEFYSYVYFCPRATDLRAYSCELQVLSECETLVIAVISANRFSTLWPPRRRPAGHAPPRRNDDSEETFHSAWHATCLAWLQWFPIPVFRQTKNLLNILY